MQFPSPIAFEAALAELRKKKLVPTAMSTAELQQIAADIRLQALFSARMTQLQPLQALLEGLTEMLEGTSNLADAKMKLTEVYRRMGYDAELGGFAADAPGTVPPARKGSLTDLASEKRMTLTITTNFAEWVSGRASAALRAIMTPVNDGSVTVWAISEQSA